MNLFGSSSTGYDGPMDVLVACGNGSYPSEVSWQIYDYTGAVVLEGGAPYNGCLGDCGDEDNSATVTATATVTLCVNDDSTADSYGDTCSSWYDDF